MRITPTKLHELTGLQQPAAQARWFKANFGVAVPCDRRGPIITDATFEAMVAKSCGIAAPAEAARPQVKLRERKQ